MYTMKALVFIIPLRILSFVNADSTTYRAEHNSSSNNSAQSHEAVSTHSPDSHIKPTTKKLLNSYTDSPYKRIAHNVLPLNKIQENDLIYVDKTKFALELLKIKGINFFLLMRPRGFGKTFLVETLADILKAKKSLFKDYYIGNPNNGCNWEEHTVVHITFSRSNIIENFEKDLKSVAEGYGVGEDFTNVINLGDLLFSKLLERLARNGKPIAVLFDEYDIPFKNGDKVIRKYFQGIYWDVKHLLESSTIDFMFVTGINHVYLCDEFAGRELFSVWDISMDEDFASLCGFTIEEIKFYFHEHVTKKAKIYKTSEEFIYQKIEEWYAGYHFTSSNVTVFNPFSLSRYLYKNCYLPENFWIQTHSYSNYGYEELILTRIKNEEMVLNLKGKYSKRELLLASNSAYATLTDFSDVSNVESWQNIPLVAFFYQHGYLTLESVSMKHEGLIYFSLRTPNKEISMMLDNATKTAMERIPYYLELHKSVVLSFKSFNISEVANIFSVFINSYAKIILYDITIEEKVYQRILHTLLTISEKNLEAKGWVVRKEQSVNKKKNNELQINQKGFVDFYIETLTHRVMIECKQAAFNINREFEQIENYIFPHPKYEYNPPLIPVRLLYNFDNYNIKQWIGKIYDTEDKAIKSTFSRDITSMPRE